MPGLEVEYLTRAAVVAKSRTEHIPLLKPASEHQFVGLWDIEGLAVQLLKKLEVIGHPRRDGVGGEQIPNDLIAITAAGQISLGTHDLAEYLGLMPRMEHDQTHLTRKDPRSDLCDQRIGNLLVYRCPHQISTSVSFSTSSGNP